MLFFAIPFPMILYYNINYNGDVNVEGTNPWLAMSYLVLSAVLWILVISKLFRAMVFFTFKARANINKLLKEGILKEAKVLEVKSLRSVNEGVESLELIVEMKNFSDTSILQKLEINDSKPELKRYEEGKIIQLRIDKSLKSVPFFVVDGVNVMLRSGKMILQMIGWILIVCAVIAYYLFSYHLESNGAGWRFLVFWHPLVLCPIILLFYQIGLGALLGKLVGNPKDALRLKYYGKRALAKIISAKQTGTYINEQPQVKFILEFLDDEGKKYNTDFKQVISLLEVSITQRKEIEIFYLPENPQKVSFAKDLEF